MTDELKDPAASMTQRLRNRAAALGIPFQAVLEYYAIFRFLYQLAASHHRDTFILKGGLAFLGWGLDLRRPTRDIDFQSYTENSAENLLAMVKDICQQSGGADPLIFDVTTIKAVPIIAHADQTGMRVKLIAKLAKIQIPMQIDFSFSNVITPGPLFMEYPDPIGIDKIYIQGYPPETAIAEKLEAMVKWDTANTRLKDYYDIWLLSQNRHFVGQVLARAIKATFAKRGTSIPTECPLSLSQDFAVQQQAQWNSFLEKFSTGSAEIRDFPSIVAQVRDFALPVLRAADTIESFDKNWSPQTRWG